MPEVGMITPSDLVDVIEELLDHCPDQWKDPGNIWKGIQLARPDLAELVEYRVARYKDPVRNNPVWFVSNTLYHVSKIAGVRLATAAEEPEVKAMGAWLAIRKDASGK